MFNIGFSELVLIGVIALLVVGPQKLPDLARQAGSWIGKLKHLVNSARTDIEDALKPDDVKRILDKQQNEISRLKGMISETRTELHETGDSVKDIEAQADSRARRSRGPRTRTGPSQHATRPQGPTKHNDATQSSTR